MTGPSLPGFSTQIDRLAPRRLAVWVLAALVCPAATVSAATQLIVSNDVCLVSVCPTTHPPPPISVAAGTVFPLAVLALDATGSRDFTYTGTVHFTSSDPRAAFLATYTFTAADQGGKLLSASFATLGSQSIAGTDDSVPPLSGTLTLDVTSPSQGIPALSIAGKVVLGAILALATLILLRSRA